MYDIDAWKKLSQKLKALKTQEAEIRRDICEQILADAEMTNGRVTVKDNYDGYAIKATQTLSYTIDVGVLGTVWEALSYAEKDCVVMKPSLSLAAYKQLPPDSLLHEAVVTRLAMPTLAAEVIL